MLVVIDESGDTGFKESSSRYFVMTMVVFDDCNDKGCYPSAEHTANTIRAIIQDTGHKPEFHFSQCSHKIRHAFFNGLNANNCEFNVYALVVDKEKLYSHELRHNSNSFYNFLLKQLLKHNPIHGAKIKIDGNKSGAFKSSLKTYLRTGQDGMLSKLKFKNSKNDVLVQLADMCCSAIAYNYKYRSDKLKSDAYQKLIGKRIKNIWEFK